MYVVEERHGFEANSYAALCVCVCVCMYLKAVQNGHVQFQHSTILPHLVALCVQSQAIGNRLCEGCEGGVREGSESVRVWGG